MHIFQNFIAKNPRIVLVGTYQYFESEDFNSAAI